MDGNKDGARRPMGLVEYLFAELRHGLQDIRQKVLEEGWFGRVVSAEPVVEVSPLDHDQEIGSPDPLGRRHSFDELWRPAERSQNREVSADLGIER